MRKFSGWVLVVVGLLWAGRAGVKWKEYVSTHYVAGGLSAADWGYLAGVYLPGVLFIIVGALLLRGKQ